MKTLSLKANQITVEKTTITTDKLSFSQKLDFTKKRLDQLNTYRIERAMRANNQCFTHVFSLLPLLIHLNHPTLPAYVENAPQGIWRFELSDYQKQSLMSYSFDEAISAYHLKNQISFDALYCMGSIGSITQTSLSDLDLWLCYSNDLTIEQYKLMELKITKLQEWAKTFDVDINIFLMNPEQFKAQTYSSGVTDEHSGSAQHFFLLDEFYRSAILLAGKRLLWLHLHKNEYLNAHNNPDIDLSEWIDFGDFSSLSTSEFFGASLWQLYKGINNPYKSAIKILLLECYAHTYPKTKLISKEFKKKILSDEAVTYHFDPYLAMLELVTEHLIARKEWVKLDRLRVCFYTKAIEGTLHKSWRANDLQELVESWSWNEKQTNLLFNRPNWKIKQVMKHEIMLVDHLLQSYRNLIHFARKFHINPSIMTNDIDILMRRLYSVFENLPGKVSLINPKISSNLAEPNLTIIEARTGGSMQPGWYLVNQVPKSQYDAENRYVHYNRSPIKLIAWGYFNGIINAATHLHTISSSLNTEKLRQFITDLRLSFPIQAPEMTDEDLYHPNEIRNLSIAINLVQDPTLNIQNLPKKIQQSDLFNFSSSQKSLVGSVSIIYRNVWNEIRTQHFEGDDAILKALKLVSNRIYQSASSPQSVNVFCYSKYLRSELRDFVADLVHKCITIQTGCILPSDGNDTFKMAGKTWQLVFSKQNFGIRQVEEQAVENADNFANTKTTSPENNKKSFPKQISEFASEGFLQFFFEDNSNSSFNVYIVDERNNVESYYNCQGNKEEKIIKINKLQHDKHLDSDEYSTFSSFNHPQFYQLISLNDDISIVPYQSRQHLDYLAQKALSK
ncbi:Adenylate cyclase [Mannheimia varigena USDA-ARS-USMARC-1296]|uniref:Adenylate cyclase n=1 Tax=Mannheimia varigena USDA-ARS-USMARC-1296 TaxID=1433287 RepID=W0Q9V2_9PAST|nr:class I adenylate cyclase [Mannheimia varigena]AHG75077.1 Adenylate cyclase [Mannheimia varigena USDA-ARS-USMARC-1296]